MIWGLIAALIVVAYLAVGHTLVWFLDREAVRQGGRAGADWEARRRSTWGLAAAWPLLAGALLYGLARELLSRLAG